MKVLRRFASLTRSRSRRGIRSRWWRSSPPVWPKRCPATWLAAAQAFTWPPPATILQEYNSKHAVDAIHVIVFALHCFCCVPDNKTKHPLIQCIIDFQLTAIYSILYIIVIIHYTLLFFCNFDSFKLIVQASLTKKKHQTVMFLNSSRDVHPRSHWRNYLRIYSTAALYGGRRIYDHSRIYSHECPKFLSKIYYFPCESRVSFSCTEIS